MSYQPETQIGQMVYALYGRRPAFVPTDNIRTTAGKNRDCRRTQQIRLTRYPPPTPWGTPYGGRLASEFLVSAFNLPKYHPLATSRATG